MITTVSERPILEYYRVNAAIREALKPRVDLPSGGYIIIEPTEALTVIDVNSGSFTRSATARETVLWTNCEAAVEIARQLRLRNVAGVIIVDFIDMDSRRDQLQVLENFNKALRADKSRPQIAQLSELGLVELTRKRQGQNIYELFGQKCPSCDGLGHLVHLPGEAAPMVHDVSATLIPEYPTASSNGRGRESREPQRQTDEEMDNSNDLQALDLLHHPSYQERGNNRRRRRRRGGPEPATRSSSRSERGSSSPTLSGRSAKDNAGVVTTRESRVEKTERRSRREKTPSEPPEVVVVEMTPQEQDVYALMGISPLALSTATVKTPKTAIVNVALPGEGGKLLNTMATNTMATNTMATNTMATNTVTNASETDPSSRMSAETPTLDDPSEDDVTATRSPRKVIASSDKRPIPRSARTNLKPQVVSVTPENVEESQVDAEIGAEETPVNTTTTRRRRRRSSAS